VKSLKYIIGIDGGGTKTLGYISDLEGKILGKGISGPSNYHSVGLERTKQSILNVITELLGFVNGYIKDLKLLVLGLAGIDRDDDKKILLEMLKSNGLNNEIILKNDAVVASLVSHFFDNLFIESLITSCGLLIMNFATFFSEGLNVSNPCLILVNTLLLILIPLLYLMVV